MKPLFLGRTTLIGRRNKRGYIYLSELGVFYNFCESAKVSIRYGLVRFKQTWGDRSHFDYVLLRLQVIHQGLRHQGQLTALNRHMKSDLSGVRHGWTDKDDFLGCAPVEERADGTGHPANHCFDAKSTE